MPALLAGINLHTAFLPEVGWPASGDTAPMFSVHCAGHGTEVLLSPTSIEALRNTRAGIEVHWRCRCGTRGVELTGAGSGTVGMLGRPADPVGRAGADRPGTAA